MTMIKCLIFACLAISTITSTNVTFEKKNFYVLGLYSSSACQYFSSSAFHYNCSDVPKHWELFENKIKFFKDMYSNITPIEIILEPHNISDESSRLLPILLKKFVFRKATNKIKYSVVVSHLSYKLTILVNSILLAVNDTIHLAFTHKALFPTNIFNREPMYAESFQTVYNNATHEKLIKQLSNSPRLSSIFIFSLCENKLCLKDVKKYNKALDLYQKFANKSHNACIKSKIIDVHDGKQVRRLLSIIRASQNRSLTVFQGTDCAVDIVWSKLNYNSEIAINYYIIKEKEHSGYPPVSICYQREYVIPHEYKIYGLIERIVLFGRYILYDNLSPEYFEEILKIQEVLNLFQEGCNSTTNQYTVIKCWSNITIQQRKEILKKFDFASPKVLFSILKIWKNKNYGDLIKAAKILPAAKKGNVNMYTLNTNKICGNKNVTCREGEIRSFTEIGEKFGFVYYGWHCHKCDAQSKFIEYQNGSRSCKKCRQLEKSNKERTKCVDKYKKLYLLSKNDWIGPILLFLSVVLLLFIVLCAFVFLRNIRTPFVRSSDIKLSFMLLVGHMLFVIFLCFMFFGSPTATVCLLRPYFFGIPFTFLKALHISKTQKFLMIFYARQRLTNQNFRCIRQTEVLIVVVLLIISVFIVILTQLDPSPQVKYKLQGSDLQFRVYYCSNDEDMLAQYYWILALTFIIIIQGIRARDLPREYRDPYHGKYSPLISILIMITSVIIYTTNESELWKTVMLFTCGFIMNASHVILFFWRKIYMIVFRPEKNTKHAFDMKRRNLQLNESKF